MDWIREQKTRKSDNLEITVRIRYVEIDGHYFRYYQREGYDKSFYTEMDFSDTDYIDLFDDCSLEYKTWTSCFKGPENGYYYAFLLENIRNVYRYTPKIQKVKRNEKDYMTKLSELISDYKEVISEKNLYKFLDREMEKIIQEKFEEIK